MQISRFPTNIKGFRVLSVQFSPPVIIYQTPVLTYLGEELLQRLVDIHHIPFTAGPRLSL